MLFWFPVQNLMIDMESEMLGDTEEITFALMMTPIEYDAFCLHEAVEGLGTSEPVLIAVLCTRSGTVRSFKPYSIKFTLLTIIQTDFRRLNLYHTLMIFKFKHIYFTSIEKQVLTTYTNLSRFCFLGTTPVLAPNVWANEKSQS